MAGTFTDPYYYASRLRDLQGQTALTTGRAISPEEERTILSSELEARYSGDVQRRQLNMQQQSLNIQADANKRAAEAANQQAMGATVGGVGQLALGTAAISHQLGWWGGAPAAIAPVDGYVGGGAAIDTATGITTTGYGGMAGGTAAGGTAITGSTAAGTTGLGFAGTAIPAAAGAAAMYGYSQIAKGPTEFGRSVRNLTPWNDKSTGGQIANIVTAPLVAPLAAVHSVFHHIFGW